MSPVLYRRWQIFAMLVILGLIGSYFYLRVIGRSEMIATLTGIGKHHVATLGDYVQFKRDPDRFYDAYPAAGLSFDCERIRDDFVKLTQSIISTELSTSAATIVWREGRTLHLGDPSVSGITAFAAWRSQTIKLATVEHPPEASHYGTLLQALFTFVRIHGRDAAEEFGIETKRSSKSDACG